MIIVCGTDFSPGGIPAMEAASALSSAWKADLWLVHALDPSLTSLGAASREAVLNAARARLSSEAARLQAMTAGRVAAEIIEGPASSALVEFGASKSADLIVVGSSGHARARFARIGSTCERVAQGADRPVLIVRDSGPFRAWRDGERHLRVTVGVDNTSNSEPALAWVAGLAQQGGCDVVVAQVYYPDEERRRYGLPSCTSLFDPDEEVEQLLGAEMRDRFARYHAPGAVTIRPVLGMGRTGDHLVKLARDERADLLVVGTRHRHGPGRLISVSRVALNFAECSVAVVPVPEAVGAPEQVPAIRRVLVATDLSPGSTRAAAFAYAMLNGRGGEVFMLHVAQLDADLEKVSEAIRTQLRTVINASGDVRSSVLAEASPDVAGTICAAAERLRADAICVARPAHRALSNLRRDATVDGVLRQSRRPVVVVHAPD